jgi:hypothetical protein
VESFAEKLARSRGIAPPPPPCPVQELFDRYKMHLAQKTFATPLPEDVVFLAENFPYLIQLENLNPADPAEWIPAKANAVIPLLENRLFDQSGFKFDESRAKAFMLITPSPE